MRALSILHRAEAMISVHEEEIAASTDLAGTADHDAAYARHEAAALRHNEFIAAIDALGKHL